MDVSNVVIDDVPTVTDNTRMGSLRSKFKNEQPKGVVVVSNGEYIGVVEEKKLMNSHIPDQTKADSLADSAPKITEDMGVREVAKSMIDGSVKLAPVFKNEELSAVVTQNSVLRAVQKNLSAVTVDDVCTKNVHTVGSKDTIGEVVSVIRTNGVSRVPVEDDGEIKGIVTTEDVVSVSVRSESSMTEGSKSGEKDKINSLPVGNIMSYPVETIHADRGLDKATGIMLENEYGGLVVESDDRRVYGIVTKTDIVRSLTLEKDSDSLSVQITNVNLMDGLNRESIRAELQSIAEKYQDMNVHSAHVRFHVESNNTLRGDQLVKSTVRFTTNKDQIAGTGEGYGSRESFNIACDKLERNVLDKKSQNDPSSLDLSDMTNL